MEANTASAGGDDDSRRSRCTPIGTQGYDVRVLLWCTRAQDAANFNVVFTQVGLFFFIFFPPAEFHTIILLQPVITSVLLSCYAVRHGIVTKSHSRRVILSRSRPAQLNRDDRFLRGGCVASLRPTSAAFDNVSSEDRCCRRTAQRSCTTRRLLICGPEVV